MKILWIGEIVLDKTYVINWEITVWQKHQSNDSLISLWWPVPVALKLLRNFWCETTIVWTVWYDSLAEYAIKQFDLYGIKHRLIYDYSTKLNTILIDEQSWTRTILKDTINNKQIQEIPISLIQEADIILFDRTEKKAFDFILKHKKPKTKIIVDPSNDFSPEVMYMVKNSYIPIFPIETVDKLKKGSNFECGLKKLYKHIWHLFIVTDWWNGSYVFDGKSVKKFEALQIRAIDTNGAWDVYRWAFSWWLLQGWNVEGCIQFANKVAWLHCLKRWNMTAVPSREEINNFTL